MTYNPVTCSMQDFMSRMNHFDVVALRFASPYNRTQFNQLYAISTDSLHQAMGYRAEHLQEDQF